MDYELYFDKYLPNLEDNKKKFIKETDLAHKMIVFQSAYFGFTVTKSIHNTSLILNKKNELNYFVENLHYFINDKPNIKDEALNLIALLDLYDLNFFTPRKKISDLQTGDIFKFNDKLLMKTSVIDKFRNMTLCVEPDGQAKFYPDDSVIE